MPEIGSAAPGRKSPRWSAERRASRVMGRAAPHSRGPVASRKRDKRNSAPVGAPPTPLRVGREWIRDQPGRRNASRERDVLRGTRPRSGLFDIVKKDGARPMPRAAFAFARGSLTHIWKPRIAAQAPVGLGWTGGGRPGAKPVRTQSRFRSRYLLGRMVSSKACKFRDHAPAGTTAMTNAESNEKRRTPCHAAARSCASNRQSPGHAGLWTRRATL